MKVIRRFRLPQNWWRPVWLGGLALLLLAFEAAAAPVDGGPDARVLPGLVVVQFKTDPGPLDGAAKTGMASFDLLAEHYRVYHAEPTFPFLEPMAAKRALPPGAAQLERIYTLRYEGPQPPRRVAAALAQDPNVAWAEPYFVYQIYETARAADGPRVSATPNDPRFAGMTHLPHLRLPEAWDVVKGEQGDVIVAIIDGGTDWRHPDLMANVWTNPGETSGNDFDDDGNGFIDDVHGWNFADNSPDPTGLSSQPQNAQHGTAVAGTAAAVTDNALGVAGTSWNATFMPIGAACPNDDGLICFGYSGILYAAANGAAVINVSWGGPERSEQAQRVIDIVYEMGALVVASAGNDRGDADQFPSYPANFEHVLSVGAIAKDRDTKASFSNYGKSVDVFAPGLSIDTTLPDGTYGLFSGTSFSAPLVAGIAALVKTHNPSFSVDQLREQIRVTSDNIDAANPSFQGKMGRGRANAFRAVTETDIPAIRIDTLILADSGGNGTIESGETVQLTPTFINYLAAASDVTITLATDDPFVIINNPTVNVGAMASGATATVNLSFEMAANTPDNRPLLLFLEVGAGAYADAEIVRLFANQTAIATHSSGTAGAQAPLQVSITNEGNIGYLEFQGDSPGVGYVTRGRDVLFEGGLLVATGPGQVSDCVRGLNSDPALQHEDLVLQDGTALQIVSPAAFTNEQGQVSLTDAAARAPIGLLILQESYVDTAPANQEFIILSYTLTNTTDQVVSNLFAGLFFDWDVNRTDPQRDAARFDEERQFGYVQDGVAGASLFVGAKLLVTDPATDAPLNYRAIDNTTEIYGNLPDGGFTEQEKWDFLSGGIQVKTLNTTDVSQMVSAGPYSLDPGASVQLAFAVAAAVRESDLFERIDAAQDLWSRIVPTSTEDPAPELPRFVLDPVYPNPAVPPAQLAFVLDEPSRVTLTVYDLLGRQVQTLVAGPRGIGRHIVAWDGRDAAGHQVAGGVYFVRLTAAGATATHSQSQSVVVLK